MRQTLSWSEVTGTHEGTTSGYVLKSSHDFTTAGVTSGIVVQNTTTGKTGVVYSTGDYVDFDYLTLYYGTTIDSWPGSWDDLGYLGPDEIFTSIIFNPGDFFIVTLATAWTVTNEFGPIYEFICKRCGVQCKRKAMVNGMCPECQDEDGPK